MRLRAIVTRGEINETVLEKRKSLLKHDSVHGDFHGTVHADIDKKALIINGTTVHIISANSPEEIDLLPMVYMMLLSLITQVHSEIKKH